MYYGGGGLPLIRVGEDTRGEWDLGEDSLTLRGHCPDLKDYR